ncbi:O-antigen ligase family protein [Alsobacter sp. R-9]
MTDAALASPSPRARSLVPAHGLQRALLFALTGSSFVAFIEPSPYEGMFVLCALAFMATGLRMVREAVLIVALLMAYNVGGLFSLLPFFDEQKSVMFVAISFYLSVTAVFFVLIMQEDTAGRLRALELGSIVAAVLASITAIIGFFDIAGLGPMLTRYEGSRATGTFKDPNVLGPFLVLPAIFLVNRLLTGTTRRFLLAMSVLGLVAVGLLLTFSRGAWGVFAAAVLLTVGLNFLVSRTHRLRVRIVFFTGLGLAAMAVAVTIALSFEKVSEMLETRASLVQSYDTGETGRFGLQKRSIPLLLEEPNGFGPLQFSRVMGHDPHNVYINGFASYGWLGGFAYLALIAATLFVGWRGVFQKTPWQPWFIPVWASLFPQIVQGLQIDSDHWRHFWLMFGLTWGLAIANERWLRRRSQAAARIPAARAPA